MTGRDDGRPTTDDGGPRSPFDRLRDPCGDEGPFDASTGSAEPKLRAGGRTTDDGVGPVNRGPVDPQLDPQRDVFARERSRGASVLKAAEAAGRRTTGWGR